MPRTEEHWVSPTDSIDNESFRLATTDLMVPPVYSTYGIVVQLNHNCDRNRIVQWLKRGLEITLSQLRQLVGIIEKNEFGDFSVVRTKNSSVRFNVRWLDEAGFVSYSELADGHFSSHAFGNIPALCVDGRSRYPRIITGISVRQSLLITSRKGMFYGTFHPLHTSPHVSAFQLNFIQGGLILTMNFHHCVIDNAGFGGFVYQLAENFYSIIQGARPPIWDMRCLDRSRFRCKDKSNFEQMNMPSPQSEKNPRLQHRPNTALLLHLPRSKAETLKQLATPPEGNIRISTYDAFCALLWRLVLKHREKIYSVDPNAPAFYYQVVNMRSRLGLPVRFQGNALLALTTDDIQDKLSIAQVIADSPLWRLATCIRQVTNTATSEALQSLLDRASVVRDKTELRHFSTPLTTMSLGVTDVREPSICDADFGFGKVKAFRHFFYPVCPETLIVVYPPRPSDNENDAGCEFRVPIEKELVDGFLNDPDVQDYFDFHGFEA